MSRFLVRACLLTFLSGLLIGIHHHYGIKVIRSNIPVSYGEDKVTTRRGCPTGPILPVDTDRAQGKIYKIPNVVHYVWFGANKTFRFHHLLSFLSASRFLNPFRIFVHGDAEPAGPLWKHTRAIIPNMQLCFLSPKSEIFGKYVNFIEHKADIARIELLLTHGGIYLDTDVFVLKSFDPLRVFEVTMGQEIREPTPTLNNGVILSTAGSTFLWKWYSTYRTFNHTLWIRHSCEIPYELSQKYPDQIHVEKYSLNYPDWTRTHLIFKEIYNWKNNYAMHTFYRCQKNVEHTAETIKRLNSTFGQMARWIYYGSPEMM